MTVVALEQQGLQSPLRQWFGAAAEKASTLGAQASTLFTNQLANLKNGAAAVGLAGLATLGGTSAADGATLTALHDAGFAKLSSEVTGLEIGARNDLGNGTSVYSFVMDTYTLGIQGAGGGWTYTDYKQDPDKEGQIVLISNELGSLSPSFALFDFAFDGQQTDELTGINWSILGEGNAFNDNLTTAATVLEEASFSGDFSFSSIGRNDLNFTVPVVHSSVNFDGMDMPTVPLPGGLPLMATGLVVLVGGRKAYNAFTNG